MAAGRLPAPGTEFGPCEPSCQHADCAGQRLAARTICHLCDKPIGYETRFYLEGEATTRQLVHAVCLEATIDA